MQIEVGKFYKTRDGRKYRVYATDGAGDYPVHGAVLMGNGWSHITVTKDGSAFVLTTSEFDIISEWVETPEVDWSLYPKWWDWIAMDDNGDWYGFWESIPEYDGFVWCNNVETGILISPQYAPKYNGHAKHSLVKRPQ